ncbi:phosphate/phosphite/phosphonate ABC transporter substrate-binding protein [Coraliomargarita sp. W4R72]
MIALHQFYQCIRLTLLLSILTGSGVTVVAMDESRDERPVLNVSFDRSMFKGLNENDAVAALRMWTQQVTEKQGIDVQIQISSYDSRRELDALLAAGQVDLLITNSLRYLKTEQSLRDTMTPHFVTTLDDGSPYERYDLITHVDSGIASFNDLTGKDVLLIETSRANLTQDWFFQEVDMAGIAPEAINTHVVAEVSKALLPVFFKKSDACVVNRDAYELMQEFNPQLGRQLHTIVTSPEFAEVLICMRDDYQTEREKIIENLGTLHSDEGGRQMMLVFKISQLIPYQPHYLDSVAELLQEQQHAEEIRSLAAQLLAD